MKKTTSDPYDNPICKSCIGKYKEKFPSQETFDIKCSGIRDYKDFYSPSWIKSISEVERTQLHHLHDTIAWAKDRLDWTPRSYQAEELKCTATRRVMRFGRRTGKTEVMCISMLHKAALNPAMKQPSAKVIVATPHESQQKLIYNRLLELIALDSTISSRVSQRQSPFCQLSFEGTGQISIFVCGTNAGQAAKTIRGYGGNYFYLDEGDYMNPDDYGTIMPMVNEPPGHNLTVSSTPTGRRERFYDMCHDPRVKERHVTIHDREDADDAFFEDCRKDAGSDLNFQLEYMAEFGDALTGVYKREQIDAALYDDMELGNIPLDVPLFLGVDWNADEVGDWIAIIAQTGTHLELVDMQHIAAKGRTQALAIAAIKNLNLKYPNIQGIYCDAGYGETQIEMLHIMGSDAKKSGQRDGDARLLDVVKPVQFSSTIEIIDPSINQAVKKKPKPYMTERSVWYLENSFCKIPRSLDDRDLLVGQMRNYSIISRGVNGMPKYSEGNQHALIAWQLAILAYDLECGTFTRRPISPTSVGRIAPVFNKSKEGDSQQRRGRGHSIAPRSSGKGRGLSLPSSGRSVRF